MKKYKLPNNWCPKCKGYGKGLNCREACPACYGWEATNAELNDLRKENKQLKRLLKDGLTEEGYYERV